MKWVILVWVLAGSGCWFPEDQRNVVIGEMLPPRFVSAEMTGTDTARLVFDRPAEADPSMLQVSRGIGVSRVQQEDSTLLLTFTSALERGEQYMLQGTFSGAGGSSLQLSIALYGFNPNPAEMIINELTSRGSNAHPDRIELFVTASGNTGGITCYDGTPQEYRQRKILPAVDVEKGSYIILHVHPDSSSVKDELEHTAESSAVGTHDEAWDFFIPEGIGLSGNNGVITVTYTPQGALMDGVFYSNRTSDSDERYRGFGSTLMLQQVMRLCRMGGWDAHADHVRPEDGIPSTYSTATRSMSRLPDSYTRHNRDWITAPTRGATFGWENNTQPYIPDP